MTDAPQAPTTEPGAAPPPPGVQSPAPRPPLRRTTRDERVLGGVLGGVARSLGVDPVPVRVGFVVLAVLAPPLVLAYLACWLLVPEDGSASTGVVRQRDAGFWLGIGIAAVLTIGLASQLDDGGFSLAALALIGIGVALWRRGDEPAAPGAGWPAAAATSGAGAVADASGQAAVATSTDAHDPTRTAPSGGGGGGGWDTPAGSVPAWTPPPVPTRERSSLGPLTLGLALVGAGVGAALDAAGVVALDFTQLVGVAAAVIGLGLVVGSVLGRARWLTLVAFVLLPAVFVGSAARGITVLGDVDLSIIDTIGDGVGERFIVLDDPAELDAGVDFGLGAVEIDLTDVELSDDATFRVDQGIGQVVIELPADVRWRLGASVGLGEVRIETDGEAEVVASDDAGVTTTRDGLEGMSLDVRRTGGPATGPLLDIDVDLGIGEVRLVTTTTTTEELQ
jgi:phage shock protein PspC (stress-responsive transcriptional regulator)